MSSLKLFASVLVLFVALDFVWLGIIMKEFYNVEFGSLAQRSEGAISPRWGAAILVYLLIPAGLIAFVGPIVNHQSSIAMAFLFGGMYGLVVYGVYDLTNYSLIEKWTLKMTIIDIAWGIAICGTVSVAMRLISPSISS